MVELGIFLTPNITTPKRIAQSAPNKLNFFCIAELPNFPNNWPIALAIKPGPLEVGYDYAFILPATGDRVPCVYVENHDVVGYDPADPIRLDYTARRGEPESFVLGI